MGCGASAKDQIPEPAEEEGEGNNISKLLLIDYKKMKADHSTKWKNMLKEAQEKVVRGADESLLDEVEEQIAAEAKRIHMQTALSNRACLEKIWDEYDIDRSGSLDKKEVYVLMQDYFNSAFRYFALVVKDRCLRKLQASNSQYGVTMENDTGSRLEKIIFNSSKKNVRIWLGELNNKSQMEAMYLTLDADKSNSLDKEEFLRGFMDVIKVRCGEKQVLSHRACCRHAPKWPWRRVDQTISKCSR